MPRYSASDIAHTAATDHQIVRRRPEPERASSQRPDGALALWRSGAPPLLPSGAFPDLELARDLGVALARLAADGKGDPPQFARRAVALLEESLPAFPDDVPAWEAKGQALTVLGRQAEGLAAFEAALATAPRRERSLLGAAMLAQNSNILEKALDYWQRAVDVDPWAADYHGNLARLLEHKGASDEARVQCQIWLRLDPGSMEARNLWIRCLNKQGDKAAARAEMDKLQRLR
jgi:tetratricopeptide (TPR) repeat protein